MIHVRLTGGCPAATPLHPGKHGRVRVALAMVGAGSRDHDRKRRNKEAANIQGVILTMHHGIEVRECRK